MFIYSQKQTDVNETQLQTINSKCLFWPNPYISSEFVYICFVASWQMSFSRSSHQCSLEVLLNYVFTLRHSEHVG